MNKAKLFNDNEKKLNAALVRVSEAKKAFDSTDSPLGQKAALVSLQGELEAIDLMIDIQLIKYKEV